MDKLNKKIKKNGGMTYVELIVVLSIFAIMSSIIIFNYQGFQSKVDIENLTNDIALKLVGAQKSAIAGQLDANANLTTWQPAYGVYFNTATPTQFLDFADLDNSKYCDTSGCNTPYNTSGDVLDITNITDGNTISSIESYSGNNAPTPLTSLFVTFTRKDFGVPVFAGASGVILSGFDYIQINVASPSSTTGYIQIYPSGRIQVD
jgi:prepilin-type N-terminal cleavage/methylation domain-containing protein